MRTILVPLDGSQLAEQALPAARTFAGLLQARIQLLRAVPDDVFEPIETERALIDSYAGPLVTTRTRERTARELAHLHAETYLRWEATCLEQAGFPTKYEVCGSDPAALINEYATPERATLVVMTTHGYSGLRRFALGSVTTKVVRSAHVPIMVLRGDGRTSALARPPRRILVPLDGSEHACAALPFALDIARRAGAELVLFQALTLHENDAPGHFPIQTEEDYFDQQTAMRTLDNIIAQFGTPDVAARAVVAFGEPAAQIAQVAMWEQADLIVMATHGRSGVARWTLGSVADAVLHTSEVPLVLIRLPMK